MSHAPPPNPKPDPAPSACRPQDCCGAQGVGSATPSGDPEVMLTMLSQARYLASARGVVSSFAKQAGFDDTACGHIALAVDEAICNVIRHGYDKREDGVIWIKLNPVVERAETVGVSIVIEDRARQVDPSVIQGRDLADIRPGGLGVHIIREVMDAVRYEPRPDGGMRLTLVRRLPHAGSKVTFGQKRAADADNGAACATEPQRGKQS